MLEYHHDRDPVPNVIKLIFNINTYMNLHRQMEQSRMAMAISGVFQGDVHILVSGIKNQDKWLLRHEVYGPK